MFQYTPLKSVMEHVLHISALDYNQRVNEFITKNSFDSKNMIVVIKDDQSMSAAQS
jgi:hypothetical protein